MSSKSHGRKPHRKHHRPHDQRRAQVRAARETVPAELLSMMLGAGKDIVRGSGPLEAEVIASSLLGLWWGRELIEFDAEEIVGGAMVSEAGRRRTPESLALLRSIAAVAEGRLAVKAATAANHLVEVGVSGPAWLDQVGSAELINIWRTRDITGDATSVILELSHGDEPPHVLSVLIDRNLGGIVKDAWATESGEEVLGRYREECARTDQMHLEQIEPATARALLEQSFAVTDRAIRHDPPVSDEARSHRALSLALIRRLPETDVGVELYPEDARFLGLGWDVERDRFLATAEITALGRPRIVKGCVDAILEYGEFWDDGRRLRMSPTKVEVMLIDWLPRWAGLSRSQVAVMPELLELWARHTAELSGYPAEIVAETVTVIDKFGPGLAAATEAADATGYRFLREHVTGLDVWDRTDQGLRLVFALLTIPRGFDPDAGFLGDELGDAVAMAHPEYDVEPALGGDEEGAADDADDTDDVADSAIHLALHTMIAEQLWRNDPVEVWETARRLQLGPYEDHEVHHMLMNALVKPIHPVITEGKAFEIDRYLEALAALPASWEEQAPE